MGPEDDKVASVERLFQACVGQSAAQAILAYEEPIDKIRYVVQTIERSTRLVDFGHYLREILSIDALFFNEDRQFHNMAVIRRKDGSYRECPIFDNGAALFYPDLAGSIRKQSYPERRKRCGCRYANMAICSDRTQKIHNTRFDTASLLLYNIPIKEQGDPVLLFLLRSVRAREGARRAFFERKAVWERIMV